ncbi:hypothetical protein ACFWRG_32355, partial [Micromonospora tulbaghiae]
YGASKVAAAPGKGKGKRSVPSPLLTALAATKERNKENRIVSAIQKGVNGLGKWAGDILYTGGEVRTHGVCGGFSGGKYVQATAGGCFMFSKNPDGDWKFGLSGSVGVGGPAAGLAGDLSYIRSNADDLGQLGGLGLDKSVSAHYYGGLTAGHESALNYNGTPVRNSRNEPVWATSYGGGVGVNAGLGVGVNYTQMVILN